MFTDRDQLENIIYYYLNRDVDRIPADVIYPGHGVIMLPTSVVDRILIEEYIVTDQVILDNLTIQRKSVSDWIEVTIGVIGRFGEMQVLDPSQTIASGSILSMEEKFMG